MVHHVVKNCYISVRDADSDIFPVNANGEMELNLDGYAIVPIEEYDLHSEAVRQFHAEGKEE
jgi:hypothetical protein